MRMHVNAHDTMGHVQWYVTCAPETGAKQDYARVTGGIFQCEDASNEAQVLLMLADHLWQSASLMLRDHPTSR